MNREMQTLLLSSIFICCFMLLYTLYFPKPYNVLVFEENVTQVEIAMIERKMKQLIVDTVRILVLIVLAISSVYVFYSRRNKK